VLIVYCSSHFAAGKSVVDRAMAKAKKAAAAAPAASASEDTGERPAFALTSVFERLCIFFYHTCLLTVLFSLCPGLWAVLSEMEVLISGMID